MDKQTDATVYNMRTKDGIDPIQAVKISIKDDSQLGNALDNGIVFW